MESNARNKLIGTVLVAGALSLVGCSDDAYIAKHNMAKAADNFEINRRIVFYNAWLGKNVLSVEGRCAVEYKENRIYYICKTRSIGNFREIKEIS